MSKYLKYLDMMHNLATITTRFLENISYVPKRLLVDLLPEEVAVVLPLLLMVTAEEEEEEEEEEKNGWMVSLFVKKMPNIFVSYPSTTMVQKS